MERGSAATLEIQAAEMGFYVAGCGIKESSLLILTLRTAPPCPGFSNLTLTFLKPFRPRATCPLLSRLRLTPTHSTIHHLLEGTPLLSI